MKQPTKLPDMHPRSPYFWVYVICAIGLAFVAGLLARDESELHRRLKAVHDAGYKGGFEDAAKLNSPTIAQLVGAWFDDTPEGRVRVGQILKQINAGKVTTK